MFNKISFKIGFLFFVFILIIEAFIFFTLYTNLANERVEEVMESLLARGNTHRDVLEDYYDHSTIKHVGIMESASEFIVIVTNEQEDVLISSDPVEEEMLSLIEKTKNIPPEGKIVEARWMEQKYIATSSPIMINGEDRGFVYMFAPTDFIKKTIHQLSEQFTIISVITVGLTVITIVILSRFITQPLIRMKEATEQLSKGSHHVSLHTNRNDELGDLANSITKLSNELERMKSERNEFLGSISHELRTPVTYIKGYAEIMNRPQLSREDIVSFSKIIQEEAEKLAELIRNLFELAKMDQHNFDIVRENVKICDVLYSVEKRIRPVLSEKNIHLTVNCPDGLEAYVDPNRLQQVLLNILDNARKYSSKGSQIIIDALETDDYMTIAIQDEGEGIPKDDLPYVFERLYRVEKSRSRHSGGSGLGLPIAKEIVMSHGGKMTIDSELGVGTTVTIILPKGE